MQLLSSFIVLALAVTAALLNSWAQNPQASDVEKTVLTTAFYSVASGTIINTACAIVAHATRAVEPGDEMGACSPYGIVGTGVAAKLHLHWVDGYGPQEWEYVRSSPVKVAAFMRDGAVKALRFADLDVSKLGLVNSEEDSRSSRS